MLMNVNRYRKMPVEIDAIHFTGREVVGEILEFTDWKAQATGSGHDNIWIEIPTKEGVMKASPGDWIIKGVKGEFYPCKPDIFAATYEPA